MKRREHIWQHGEREWKATPDGLWARPIGREHWTFEAWFTPVVDEILRLSVAMKARPVDTEDGSDFHVERAYMAQEVTDYDRGRELAFKAGVEWARKTAG